MLLLSPWPSALAAPPLVLCDEHPALTALRGDAVTFMSCYQAQGQIFVGMFGALVPHMQAIQGLAASKAKPSFSSAVGLLATFEAVAQILGATAGRLDRETARGKGALGDTEKSLATLLASVDMSHPAHRAEAASLITEFEGVASLQGPFQEQMKDAPKTAQLFLEASRQLGRSGDQLKTASVKFGASTNALMALHQDFYSLWANAASSLRSALN